MTTKLDARQTISRDLLDQLVNATGVELDNILRAINAESTPPLRMSESTPADLTLNIDSIYVSNPETGRNRTIPTVSNTLPNFTGGTVTLPPTTGGTVTVTPGTDSTLVLSNNNYIKMGISMDANGQLTVQFGIEGATVDAATAPPSINNTFSIGYIVIYADGAGNVDNVTNSTIYQYVGGGGGGGSGDANSFLETLKNMLNDSYYEFVTPNIFSRNEEDLVDSFTGTGGYSLVTQTVEFDNPGEVLVSTQMLDADFLDESRDIREAQIAVQWRDIDTAATYEVSRDGGNEYQTITMDRIGNTDTFVGRHVFDTEAADQNLLEQTASSTTQALDDGSNQRLAQTITVADALVAREIDIDVTKVGSPIGNLYVQLVRDDTALPSTSLSDILAESSAIDIASMSNGVNTITMPDTVLAAGTYHIAIRTDSTYTGQYTTSAGADRLDVNIDATADGMSAYNGAAWADSATNAIKYELRGRTLDLRVRITSSASAVSLSGYGILYDPNVSSLTTGFKNRQVFKFNSTSNPNTFALTVFSPDPDLLRVYLAETGQVFRAPSFYLDGKTVVFPVDTFDNGGVPLDMTLIFEQLEGSSFDNSDQNALLMAGNFLGSSDATLDRSQPGRGIFLRRPDGTLREVALDDNDNLQIWSV